MFGKKTIKINGVKWTAQAIEETLRILTEKSISPKDADALKKRCDELQDRLEAANRKLADFGFMSGF